MAGLPWFELDTDYHDSPKVEALKSRLRNPEADAFPSRLYAYCYRHAVDRFDPEVASHTVESAAKWRGRRGVLFDALLAVGVLEREGGKVVVHGVAERLAPHLDHRTKAAARQRKRRADLATSRPQTRDVTRDVPGNITRESRPDKDKDKDKDPIVSEGEKDPIPESALPPALNREQVERDTARRLGAEARGGLPTEEEIWAEKWPRLGAVVAAVRASGCPADWPKAATQRHAVDLAVGEQNPEAVAKRLAVAIAESGKPWLGWHVDVIRGASPSIKTGSAAPAAHAAFGQGGVRAID